MLAIAAVSVISKIRFEGSIAELSSSCSMIDSRSGSPTTDSPDKLTPSRGDCPGVAPAIILIASRTTQRSIAWIRPNRSAAGRKAPGAIRWPYSSRIRSSSSPWLTSPLSSFEDRLQVQDEAIALERVLDPLRLQVSFATARAVACLLAGV